MWTWHTGTKTTIAGWNTNDNYKQVVMPFAIDHAQSEGWSSGKNWQSAKDLICNPSEPSDMISQETSIRHTDYCTTSNDIFIIRL